MKQAEIRKLLKHDPMYQRVEGEYEPYMGNKYGIYRFLMDDKTKEVLQKLDIPLLSESYWHGNGYGTWHGGKINPKLDLSAHYERYGTSAWDWQEYTPTNYARHTSKKLPGLSEWQQILRGTDGAVVHVNRSLLLPLLDGDYTFHSDGSTITVWKHYAMVALLFPARVESEHDFLGGVLSGE